MPPYLRLGSIPRKRHIAHRHEPGFRSEGVYYEEVVTVAGFGRGHSIAYHLRPPTRVRKVEPAGSLAADVVEEPALRHHHLRSGSLPPSGDPVTGRVTLLVNDEIILRATATFLRTLVTRDTPFDRFLARDDGALSASQRRGARLFFTAAEQGGAGCFSCHSGPMLNKQANDPDVAGIGAFVEENFINVGIGDHPLQALNALTRNRDTQTHAEDTGRQEITGDADDAYQFRSLTLRQLRDARTFFHNGSLSSVRDVVRYFNEGAAQDAVAGAAPTLDPRFPGITVLATNVTTRNLQVAKRAAQAGQGG